VRWQALNGDRPVQFDDNCNVCRRALHPAGQSALMLYVWCSLVVINSRCLTWRILQVTFVELNEIPIFGSIMTDNSSTDTSVRITRYVLCLANGFLQPWFSNFGPRTTAGSQLFAGSFGRKSIVKMISDPVRIKYIPLRVCVKNCLCWVTFNRK
jgi:hypothetical protein